MHRQVSRRSGLSGPRAAGFCLLMGGAALSGCVAYRSEPLDGAQFAAAVQERRLGAGAPTEDSRPAEVSLDELSRLALVLNPELRRARLQAGVAQASADEAGRWIDPVVGGELLRILDPDPGQTRGIYGLSLSFTIPVSGRLGVEKARAEAEHRAALLRVWEQEQRLLRDVRAAWAELVEAGEAREAVAESREQLATIADLGERLRDAGEILAGDAAAFRAAEVERSIAVGDQEARVRQAHREVARLAGLSTATLFVARSSDEAEMPALDGSDFSVPAARNPHVLLAEADYLVAEQALRLAVRKQYPDIELGPLAGREDGQDRFGFGFSMPVPVLDGNRREIAEREAEREVARAAWEQALQDAEADVATAHEELARADASLRLLHGSLLPLAESRLAEARRLREAGEFGALMLLDAFRARHEARLALAAARRDVAVARAELRYLLPDEEPGPNAGQEASRP